MKNKNKYLNDGIVLLNKHKGITSFNAINKLKWILNAEKTGHAGTLDPIAEGLLIVMINGATKFSDVLMKKDKEYYVEMELGYGTDSYDSEGKVINRYLGNIDISDEDVEKNVRYFLGDIEQVPPMFSAIKVNGEKLYNLARKGMEIKRRERKVKIHYINDIVYDKELRRVSFKAGVSSGTYIRSLVHDIGERLGVYATMIRLIRTKIADYDLRDSVNLEDVMIFFEENSDKNIDIGEINRILKIKSVETVFPYEGIDIHEEKYRKLKNGMEVLMDSSKLKHIASFKLYGIYKIYKRNCGKDEKRVFSGFAKIVRITGNKIYLKRDRYFI